MKKLLHPELLTGGKGLKDAMELMEQSKKAVRVSQKDLFKEYLDRLVNHMCTTGATKGGEYNSQLHTAWAFPLLNNFGERHNYDYSKTVQDSEFLRFFEEAQDMLGVKTAKGLFDSGLVASLKAQFSVVHWLNSGKPIYMVSPGLSQALLHTKLKGYPASGLCLPKPCIYLHLPPGEFTYCVTYEGDREAPVEGVYVSETQKEGYRRWTLLVCTSPELKEIEDTRYSGYNSDTWFINVELLEGMSAEEALENCWKTGVKESLFQELPALSDVLEKNRKNFLRTFQFVMNAVLYATSAEADLLFQDASKEYRDLKARAEKAKGDKRKKLFGRLRGMEQHPRCIMGSTIVIDRKQDHRGEPGTTAEGSRKITVRTLVSGHWHRYWTGAGRKVCIHKWIAPFWRGPEEAPLTGKRLVKLQ
jgi:hypothetical protein